MDRYLELIPSQHCDKPKFMAWLTVSMTATNDVTQALRQFTSAFDLDKAVGKQLDILGEYVGVGRVLDFQPADGSSPVLNDEIFRTLIRTRIVKNHWDGTIRQIHELWDALFPLYKLIIKDNQDMSITLVIIGVATKLEKELIARGYIAPKPQGVRVKYDFPEHAIFAYDLNNEVLTGYDEGMWL